MTDEWMPPETAIPWIVCPACKDGRFIVTGPRHFDEIMREQIKTTELAWGNAYEWRWEQGFVDQWGRFYNRHHAMDVVKFNGQPSKHKGEKP